MFSNHVYKIIILPTLVIRIPNLEIFLFCQHNSTGGGNLELRHTIVYKNSFPILPLLVSICLCSSLEKLARASFNMTNQHERNIVDSKNA
jgi:hypothetical protein